MWGTGTANELEEHFGGSPRKKGDKFDFDVIAFTRRDSCAALLCKSLKSLFGNNYYPSDERDNKHIYIYIVDIVRSIHAIKVQALLGHYVGHCMFKKIAPESGV